MGSEEKLYLPDTLAAGDDTIIEGHSLRIDGVCVSFS